MGRDTSSVTSSRSWRAAVLAFAAWALVLWSNERLQAQVRPASIELGTRTYTVRADDSNPAVPRFVGPDGRPVGDVDVLDDLATVYWTRVHVLDPGGEGHAPTRLRIIRDIRETNTKVFAYEQSQDFLVRLVVNGAVVALSGGNPAMATTVSYRLLRQTLTGPADLKNFLRLFALEALGRAEASWREVEALVGSGRVTPDQARRVCSLYRTAIVLDLPNEALLVALMPKHSSDLVERGLQKAADAAADLLPAARVVARTDAARTAAEVKADLVDLALLSKAVLTVQGALEETPAFSVFGERTKLASALASAVDSTIQGWVDSGLAFARSWQPLGNEGQGASRRERRAGPAGDVGQVPASAAVDWARGEVGEVNHPLEVEKTWYGLCLNFTGMAYGHEHSGHMSPNALILKAEAEGTLNGPDLAAPAGAIVLWKDTRPPDEKTKAGYGHAGIAEGDGNFLHTGFSEGSVRQGSIAAEANRPDPRFRYVGWLDPAAAPLNWTTHGVAVHVAKLPNPGAAQPPPAPSPGPPVGSPASAPAPVVEVPVSPVGLQRLRIANTGGMGLCLRSLPSAASEASILARLPEGTQVESLGPTQDAEGYRWFRVRAPQAEGWCATAPWLQPVRPAVGANITVSALVGTAGLRLRATAGTGGAIVARMSAGTSARVVGGPASADGFTWWQVAGPAGIGWSAVGDWLVP